MDHEALSPNPFFNRQNELAALERAWNRPLTMGQMALVYGRRRIGKTFLLQRFFSESAPPAQRLHCYYLADQSTAPGQRLALAEQILAALPDEGVQPQDLAISWSALLRYVSSACRSRGERFGLILDEFPYLLDQSPELPSVLQSWWDREGVHSPLLVVLCGSQLSSMAALGAETAPLYGRFNAGIMLVPPLRYDEVSEFYSGQPTYTKLDQLMMYGVLGGTPRYHALVDISRSIGSEITDLLLRPRAPLENEVRFLLGTTQVREPALYNGVLSAIAHGHTQVGRIMSQTGIERGSMAFCLRTLLELNWIVRECPYGETSDKRAIYRIADPFLLFWYRFVSPLASQLQFADPSVVFAARVEPYLSDYIGRYIFEGICAQWLQQHGPASVGCALRNMGRYWNRDGSIEIDLLAGLDDGTNLFAECKWSTARPVGLNVLAGLQAKVIALPNQSLRQDARFMLFSAGGFSADVSALAKDPDARLHLVGLDELLPDASETADAASSVPTHRQD